jgi:hypothetical protein
MKILFFFIFYKRMIRKGFVSLNIKKKSCANTKIVFITYVVIIISNNDNLSILLKTFLLYTIHEEVKT